MTPEHLKHLPERKPTRKEAAKQAFRDTWYFIITLLVLCGGFAWWFISEINKDPQAFADGAATGLSYAMAGMAVLGAFMMFYFAYAMNRRQTTRGEKEAQERALIERWLELYPDMRNPKDV